MNLEQRIKVFRLQVVCVISGVKTWEHFSLGKCNTKQTAAPGVIDDASLSFPSAEVSRQPDVLMLTKPPWQMHTRAAQCSRMICTYEAAAALRVTNCIADNIALIATVLNDLQCCKTQQSQIPACRAKINKFAKRTLPLPDWGCWKPFLILVTQQALN